MFRNFLVVVAILALGAAVVYAGSAGGGAPAVGRVNVPLTVPKESKTVCYTLGTKYTQQVDVSKTTMINWRAFTTAGATVIVKRSFDSYSSNYLPTTSEQNLPIEPGITKANFKPYSSATVTNRLCVEMN